MDQPLRSRIGRGCMIVIAALCAVHGASAGTVYLETYSGEMSYPLTPEIDSLGLGGMVAAVGGDGAQTVPMLTGSFASARAVSVGGATANEETSGIYLGVSPLIALEQTFVVSGHFQNAYLLPNGLESDGGSQAQASVQFMLLNTASNYVLEAGLYMVPSTFSPLAILAIGESLAGMPLGSQQEFVGSLALVGGSFDLEFVVDPANRTALARYVTAGLVIETAPISLAAFDENAPDQLGQLVQVVNFDNGDLSGGGDLVGADFVNLRLSTVPEPSLAWIAILTLSGLALERETRRVRRVEKASSRA